MAWYRIQICPVGGSDAYATGPTRGNSLRNQPFLATKVCIAYKDDSPKIGARVHGRVGAGVVWSRVGTLASPLAPGFRGTTVRRKDLSSRTNRGILDRLK